MQQIPVFDPLAIRCRELAQAVRGNIRALYWLWASDSPDYLPAGSHMHAVPQLLVCLAGSARIRTRQARPIDLGPGEALVMAPGAWHHHELLRPSSVVYLQGLLPAQSDVSLFVGGTTYGTLIPLEPSRLLLHRFFDADGASAAYSLCDELIGQFLTERAQDWVIPAGPLARMTFYYWHHLHQPIGAADIVHAGGLGPTHAGRLFRSYHHQSPKAALETSRLAIARQLLREGMAIGEIPRRCGFASLNHFERAFRRIEGLAPRVWRERHALRGWGPRGPR